MRKIYALLVVMGFAVTLKAQLVFNENFTGYTNGNLSNPSQGSWNTGSSGTDVQVANASQLQYAGYTSGTQYITVTNTNGRDADKDFSASISSSGSRSVFLSFVVRVSSASTSADYTLRVWDGSTSVFRFYAQRDGSNNLEFGTSVGGDPVFTNGNYSFNTVYFIVIRYDIVSGTNNDKAYLWVNPSPGLTMPDIAVANASNTTTGGGSGEPNGYGNLTGLQIRVQSSGAVAAYDGFRVATGTTPALAWQNLSPAGAPLPVKIDNFDAAKDGSSVKLNWLTSDELGVKLYQIERSEDGFNFAAIGSVTADKKKTYSFTDLQPAANNNFYRLKIVDFDGNVKLSHVVSIKSKVAMNVILSPNPVKDMLTVQHPKAETNNMIQIVNSDGRILKETIVPLNAVQTNIDLSALKNGMYHVVFKSNTGIFSKTILKQ